MVVLLSFIDIVVWEITHSRYWEHFAVVGSGWKEHQIGLSLIRFLGETIVASIKTINMYMATKINHTYTRRTSRQIRYPWLHIFECNCCGRGDHEIPAFVAKEIIPAKPSLHITYEDTSTASRMRHDITEKKIQSCSQYARATRVSLFIQRRSSFVTVGTDQRSCPAPC